MNPEVPPVTRRYFLAASAALLAPRLVWTQTRNGEVLEWKLDDQATSAVESVSGLADPITYRSQKDLWVGRGRNRALRLDGYSVWIDHSKNPLPSSGSLAVAAWLALESYPLNEAAILESRNVEGGFSFSIDKWGYLHFRRPGAATLDWRSDRPLPHAEWIHLVAAASGSGEAAFYLNGKPFPAKSAPVAIKSTPPPGAGVTLAKSNESPIEAGIFATGVINGLMKDVRVFNTRLSQPAIERLLRESQPDAPPDLEINKEWFPNDPQRPIYHPIPPRAWTNEPHGLIYWQGQYHLFYQKNPNGPYWGHLNWGHMTSPDLLHWMELPVAISPEPGLDSEGCWSGSVIEHDGKLVLIYTAVDGKKACICAASSSDGIHFTKYPGNPLIAGTPPGSNLQDFRDPHIWREGDRYYMIVGSGVNDVGGTALLYRSDDFVTWRYLKPLMTGTKDNSGTFWEMPIFIKLGNYHVLIVCEIPGRASYWVGTWKDETFQPLSPEPRRLELFNQALSPTPCETPDGKLVAIAVVPEMRGPGEQWQAGWSNLFSLPRALYLDEHGEPGRLSQRPLEALESLSTQILSGTRIALSDTSPKTLDGISGAVLEIDATFIRKQSKSVSLIVRRSPDEREQTLLTYDWDSQTLTLDRSHSSLAPPHRLAVQSVVYATRKPGVIDLHIFLDNSALDVFADDRDAFTSRIYPTLPESAGVAVACTGGPALLESIRVNRMRRPE